MKRFFRKPALALVGIVAGLLLAGCATDRPAGATAEQAQVRAVHGSLEVLGPDRRDWTPIFAGNRISQGMVLRTSANSTADLRVGVDGPSVRLRPNSRLELVRLLRFPDGRTQTILDLQAGEAFVDDKTVKTGSSVEIRTPRGVVSIPPK